MAEKVNKPEYIILHHKEGKDKRLQNDWVGVCKFHIEILKYIDVSYNYGIEFINNKLAIHEGRPELTFGAHTWGFNKRSLGILVMGNFDLAKPPKNLLFLTASLCRELQRKYSIPKHKIIGHRESYKILEHEDIKIPDRIYRKTCPGTKFNLEEFREKLLNSPHVNNFSEKSLLKNFYHNKENV